MPEEKEILFFLGTIFSIISVKSEDNSTHIIELTLHNDTSILIENLISDFQKSLYHLDNLHHLFMKTDDFRMINNYYFILTNERFLLNNSTSLIMYIYLAFIFSNLGLYEKAIQLYKQSISINRISMKSPQSIVLHLIIGYLYYHLFDYNNAFIYYGIVLSLIDQTNLLTGELYNHIGDVWYKITNDDIALSCYKEALIIANHQDIPSLPNIYRNLIDILEKRGNFDEVFVYKEQAKEIDRSQYHLEISTLDTPASLEYLKNQLNQNANPPSIQRIDFLYQSGLRLMKDGDFDQALTTLLEAKELILKEPPSWHRFPQLLSTLFDNIALLYLFRYDFLKALVMWKKAIDIRVNFYSH
jgi:tetratricopeptide (TPR) repeat protein